MATNNGGGRVKEGKTPDTAGMASSREDSITPNPPGILRDPAVLSARRLNTDIPEHLPHERVFPIQIGSGLFRLSGASISSDAPSYFSQFFQSQLKQAEANGDDSNAIRTLYIDRDPVTFKDISLHLQGYHVKPTDGSHFVRLFADAQFYSLPRLVSQLYEESIFISIGHQDFQIPRDLFSDPGNSPNYFTLGYAVFFSTPTEVFPGLHREGLLRPPSILPPSLPGRSADVFAQLVHILRGYPLHIKNEDHRAELLRDCRYFHLKGLEQKIIRHTISFNLARKKEEMTLRLEDVRQSGISVVGDQPHNAPSPANPTHDTQMGLVGYVNYARPFVDSKPYELVLEIGGEYTKVHFKSGFDSSSPSIRAEFFGDCKTRISRLFEVIATKLNLPTSQPLGLLMKKGGASSQPASPGNTPLNEGDLVRVVIDDDAYIKLDGREWSGREKEEDSSVASLNLDEENPRKRRRTEDGGVPRRFVDENQTWIVRSGQWRLRVKHTVRGGKASVECVLVAVMLDAFSSELGRNAQRQFLGS